MLKMNLANLQLFAHKKVEVLHQTDVIHKQNVLELKQLTDKQYQVDQFFTVNAVHTSIQVLTLDVVGTIHFLLKLKVLFVSNVKDAIKNKCLFTQSQNNA